MTFLKNLIGGAAILLFALIVGIVQNTVRSDPMKLIPRIPAATASADGAKPAKPGPGTRPNIHPPADPAHPGPGAVSDEEIAAGVVAKERVKMVSELGSAIILDARSEGEFAEAHIPGAINIPYERFVDYFDTLTEQVPMDRTVICYCRSVTCDLSDNLARELRLAGYERVVVYRGGIDEWTEAEYPVETGRE